ncbi:O-antigen ligase domain-containing protein [Lonepinella koalarum]|uniref:O-antigen ligase family protein n=1 Tax=Lonepinella koalarum TaxID=53417 RepID=UPI0011E3C220|nr:O-antigen ligase family protein [Lonepinella koalarum]TYG33821.1 O-antigen ligase domain-containing protein [Lonepinella koalarum]
MQLNSIVFYIWIVSIISLFLPFTAYVIPFSVFILFVFIDKKNYFLNKIAFYRVCLIFVFVVLATFSHILNKDVSDIQQYIKLFLNFLFLISFILFTVSGNKYEFFYSKRIIIQKTLEFIIFLTFVQVIVNVYIMNLWSMPFVGVQNSMDAYQIIEPTIFFGTKEKNIWATKFVFLSIVYYAFITHKIFYVSKKKRVVMSFLILFNILYTFSRTAQVMFVSFVFMYYIWKIFYIYKNYLLKIIAIFSLSIISILAGVVIVDKLLHITLSSGDGLAARLELWEALYLHLDKMNIFIGNGILSAQYIISYYTNWNNNNFHNVFLNIFSDMGVFGLISYSFLLLSIFSYRGLFKYDNRYINLVFFIPFFVCINSQYLGFDSDIIIYFSFVFLFSLFRLNKLELNQQ